MDGWKRPRGHISGIAYHPLATRITHNETQSRSQFESILYINSASILPTIPGRQKQILTTVRYNIVHFVTAIKWAWTGSQQIVWLVSPYEQGPPVTLLLVAFFHRSLQYKGSDEALSVLKKRSNWSKKYFTQIKVCFNYLLLLKIQIGENKLLIMKTRHYII